MKLLILADLSEIEPIMQSFEKDSVRYLDKDSFKSVIEWFSQEAKGLRAVIATPIFSSSGLNIGCDTCHILMTDLAREHYSRATLKQAIARISRRRG